MLGELVELLKKYKLGYFSFPKGIRYDVSHKDYEYLSSERYDLRTILVFQENLPDFKLKHLYEIKREKIVSILDEKVNTQFYNQNNSLNTYWDNILAKRKIFPKDEDYFKHLDAEVEKTRIKFSKQLYKKTLEEEVYYYLSDKNRNFEDLSNTAQNKAVKNFLAIPKNREKFHKKITKSRVNTRYNRVFTNQVPGEINAILDQGYSQWKQIYLIIDNQEKTIEYFTGSSRGSGSRQLHGFGAHLMASLNHIKTIKTDCLFFQTNGEVKSFTEPYLVLLGKDTKGNYAIEETESEKILKNTKRVSRAMDLDFDYFMATGDKLIWEEK